MIDLVFVTFEIILDCNATVVGSIDIRGNKMFNIFIFLYRDKYAALSFVTQHAMSPHSVKSGDKKCRNGLMGLKCLNTKFLGSSFLPSLISAGYTV